MTNDPSLPRVYVDSQELSRYLHVSDVEIACLARLGLIDRILHPAHKRRYRYELVGSLISYVALLNDRVARAQARVKSETNAFRC